MEFVEAFRKIEEIEVLKNFFKSHSIRDYTLFVLGINTGLKVRDILNLRVSDVAGGSRLPKEFLELVLDGAPSSIYLNAKVRSVLTDYLPALPAEENPYLFGSPKTKKPITRQQVHRIIRQAVEACGLEGRYGAISMRKTFGYHAYIQGVAISLIQKHYHHASPAETISYLGITEEEVKHPVIDVNL